MIIKKITIKGFKSIDKPLVISFPNGIIGIFGENESGKTAFLEAIYVALYGFSKGKAKTERDSKNNQITWERKKTKLVLEFLVGDEQYKIDRQFTEKKHECKLYILQNNNYELLLNSIKEIEKEISNLIGMDRNSFSQLVFFRQKDLDSLSDLAKKDREKMINKIVGIDSFDKITFLAFEERKALHQNLSEIQAQFDSLNLIKQDKEELVLEIKKLKREISNQRKTTKRLEIEENKSKIIFSQILWNKKRHELLDKLKDLENQHEEMQYNIAELERNERDSNNLKNLIKIIGNVEQRISLLEGLEERRKKKKEFENGEREYRTQKEKIEAFKKEYYKQYSLLLEQKETTNELEEEIKNAQNQKNITEERINELKSLYNTDSVSDLEVKHTHILKKYPRIFIVMIISLVLAIAGLAMFISSLTYFNRVLLIVSIILFLSFSFVSIFMVIRFIKLSNHKNLFFDFEKTLKELNELSSFINTEKETLKSYLKENGFSSLNEINLKLINIMSIIKKRFDCIGFEELNGALRQTEKELKRTEAQIASLKLEIIRGLHDYNTFSDTHIQESMVEKALNKASKQKEKKDEYTGKLEQIEQNISTANEKKFPSKLRKIQTDIFELKNEQKTNENSLIPKPKISKYSEKNELETSILIEELGEKIEKIENELIGNKRELELQEASRKELNNKLVNFTSVKRKKHKLEEELEILEFLINEINNISQSLRNSIMPVANAKISQILPILTGQKYTSLDIQDDFRFMVHNPKTKDKIPRELFSGGTQDQFLIALRLAFTESIVSSRVSSVDFSLLMDECFSSSDERRKEQIFRILKSSKIIFKQIFIVSHENIAKYVDHHLHLGLDTDSSTYIMNKSW